MGTRKARLAASQDRVNETTKALARGPITEAFIADMMEKAKVSRHCVTGYIRQARETLGLFSEATIATQALVKSLRKRLVRVGAHKPRPRQGRVIDKGLDSECAIGLRRHGCESEDRCLTYAVASKWRAMDCSKCPLVMITPPPIKTIEDVAFRRISQWVEMASADKSDAVGLRKIMRDREKAAHGLSLRDVLRSIPKAGRKMIDAAIFSDTTPDYNKLYDELTDRYPDRQLCDIDRFTVGLSKQRARCLLAKKKDKAHENIAQ